MLSRGSRSALALIGALLLAYTCVPSVGAWAEGSTAHAAGGSPIGNFDGPSIRLTALRRTAYDYTLYGWAADPDAPGQPTTVGVFINGGIGNNVTTSEPRPDVEAVYPWAGPNAGFSLEVAADGEEDASKTVCLYIVNRGPGHDTGLGCVTLPTPATDGHEPVGSLDEVTVAPGVVHIRGWAADRDEPGTNVTLRVFEDFAPDFALTADQPRPDVPVVFPQLDSTTGFERDLPARPGHHQLCVFVGNLGRAGLQNTALCASIDVPGPVPAAVGDPQGNQERLEGSHPVRPEFARVDVIGWAFDPDSDGPWTVRALASVGGLGFYPATEVTGTTGESRPDVEAVFPAAGPDAGYRLVTHLDVFQAIQFACVWARQEGSGQPERFIGCSS